MKFKSLRFEDIVNMKTGKNMPVLAFLDVETTGLSAGYGDRVCEIAILRLPPKGKAKKWQSLVNPQRNISYGASMVNGITNEMVSSAPLFDDIAGNVYELIEDAVVVCHNAPFDLSFIYSEFKHSGFCLPDFQVIDTLQIARNYFKFPSNKLGSIADYMGIKPNNQHRALADVQTTCKIFKRMLSDAVKSKS